MLASRLFTREAALLQFDPYTVSLVDIPETATPLEKCIAELQLEAAAYSGGLICHGANVRGTYAGSTFLGKQADGRYAWSFGDNSDSELFRSDAERICATYGVDCSWTIHPVLDGPRVTQQAIVLLDLEVAS